MDAEACAPEEATQRPIEMGRAHEKDLQLREDAAVGDNSKVERESDDESSLPAQRSATLSQTKADRVEEEGKDIELESLRGEVSEVREVVSKLRDELQDVARTYGEEVEDLRNAISELRQQTVEQKQVLETLVATLSAFELIRATQPSGVIGELAILGIRSCIKDLGGMTSADMQTLMRGIEELREGQAVLQGKLDNLLSQGREANPDPNIVDNDNLDPTAQGVFGPRQRGEVVSWADWQPDPAAQPSPPGSPTSNASWILGASNTGTESSSLFGPQESDSDTKAPTIPRRSN